MIKNDKNCIGILGGMGSYATLYFFKRFLELTPAEKEWERPHLIIDNNCVMPSRVRALVYNEKRGELVQALADSSRNLVACGAEKLVWACNTSHCFLPEVREVFPGIDTVFVDMLNTTASVCADAGISSVYVLATEGTITTRIYSEYMARYGIRVQYPDEAEFPVLREFIEVVKQNRISEQAGEFKKYLTRKIDKYGAVILGCTELSVYGASVETDALIIDPIDIVLRSLLK